MFELTAHDRCDRCGFRGYVMVTKGRLVLVFCKHHFEQHELALLVDGWQTVVDNREELLARVAED